MNDNVGMMYIHGRSVAVGLFSRPGMVRKAAAQDHPKAFGQLGVMYIDGNGVAPSWRGARELMERAIELGNSTSVEDMQLLTQSIQKVSYTSRLFHHPPYRESSLI